MIEKNQTNLVGVLPTFGADLIPTRHVKNEAISAPNWARSQTTTQTIYLVPASKIMRWTYLAMFIRMSSGDEIIVQSKTIIPSSKEQLLHYVAVGDEVYTPIVNFTEMPILDANETIEVTVVTGTPNYSIFIRGYLEAA